MINNPALPPTLRNINGVQFLSRFIPALIALGLVIGGIVFVFILITGAISWMTSGGDKMKLEQARSRITSALVGIIILFAFFAILNLVECFIGIGLRQIRIGPFDVGFAANAVCPRGSNPPNTQCVQCQDFVSCCPPAYCNASGHCVSN